MATNNKTCPYKINRGSVRRFRIWDAGTKKHLPGRCYVHERKAHDGATLIMRWAKLQTALELYDVHTGRLSGQYVRKVNGCAWTNVSYKEG